ncbi:MAG: HD domain-containing protein [Planctomycetota bacterium]
MSIRMSVAEYRTDGQIRKLEKLTQPVRLGVDVFRTGHIGAEAMRAACRVLADFARELEAYGVEEYRAIATTAVRDSDNAPAFLDRVRLGSGLIVEVVDGLEETRLNYQMMRHLIGHRFGLLETNSLVVAIGSGSVEILVLEAGEVLFAESRPVGTLRLIEGLEVRTERQARRLLTDFIEDMTQSIARLFPSLPFERLFVISSDLRALAARLTGTSTTEDPRVRVVGRDVFDRIRGELQELDLAGRSDRLGLPLEEAETVLPAAIMLGSYWNLTSAKEAVFVDFSMLDSLLLDLVRRNLPGTREEDFDRQVVSAALALGGRYEFDEAHALQVRRLALTLFDDLTSLHGLGARPRLLLEIAAILHDIGLYVNPSSHHKHSMYLIQASGLMGLSAADMQIIALTARYHRKAVPSRNHEELRVLDSDAQLVVSKLASLLRLAEALDRGHQQAIGELRASVDGAEVILLAESDQDLSLEEWSLQLKSNLFESLYGYPIRLRIRRHLPGVS